VKCQSADEPVWNSMSYSQHSVVILVQWDSVVSIVTCYVLHWGSVVSIVTCYVLHWDSVVSIVTCYVLHWDSVVSIVTCCYVLDGPWIKSQWGEYFLHTYRLALGPTQPHIQWILGHSQWWSSQGVALARHPHRILRLKKEESYPTPLLCLQARYRVIFNLLFIINMNHVADLAPADWPSKSKQPWHMVHFTVNLFLDWHYSKWYMEKAFKWIRDSEFCSCRMKVHIGKKVTLLMCLCVKLKRIEFYVLLTMHCFSYPDRFFRAFSSVVRQMLG
jgi:hypothetical protein